MIVYYNGAYLPADQVKISPQDRGFLLGDGVFETIYVNQGKIECLKAHEILLHQNAQELRLVCPPELDHLKQIIDHLMELNNLKLTSAAVRVTLTRGVGQRGLLPPPQNVPTLLVTISPYDRKMQSWRLAVANDRAMANRLTSVKHLGYQQAILARLEAQDQGYDDAVFFNEHNNLIGATVANVFVFCQGNWLTPPVSSGARPGVMRGRVLERSLATVQNISLTMVKEDVEAMVLTNSLMGIQPVQQLDDQELDVAHAKDLIHKFYA
jgi:branched-subunit amino acid aminotransferase/4-amino-4-deoxychorismate lyase